MLFAPSASVLNAIFSIFTHRILRFVMIYVCKLRRCSGYFFCFVCFISAYN